MPESVLVAVIGAVATIVAAFIGAKKSAGSKKKAAEATGAEQPRLRSEIALIAAAIVVGAGLVTFAIYQNAGVSQRDLSFNTRSFTELVKAGLSRKPPKEYVIPSITMIIRPELVGNPPHIEADVRIVYTVHALSSAKYPQRAFNDFAHSSTSSFVKYLHGSEQEKVTEAAPAQAQWDVFYDRTAGERRTIITGYKYIYPPVLETRTIEGMFERVGPSEDAFCYPNTDEDVIEELTIFIESDTLQLTVPEGVLAAGIKRGSKIDPVQAHAWSTPGLARRVVVARFPGLQPDDVAGLRVAW